MSLADFTRLTLLLSRLSGEPSPEPMPGVEEHLDLYSLRTGAPYDLYLPRGARLRVAVVAVHGVTGRGRREPRLVHFARCLARSGAACAVPTLEGMAACRTEPGDLDTLEDVTRATAAETDRRPGLVGFSYGASFSLVVAARPSMADQLRFVLAIGAYHSLADLHRWYTDAAEPSTDEQWDDHIYLHLVIAMRMLQELDLSRQARRELTELFAAYCHHASPEQKRATYHQRLKPLDLLRHNASTHDEAVVDAISPAGKLAGVRCPVSLIHDEHDVLVPPSHAEAIHAELQQAGAADHRLLITSLLSHVTLTGLLKLGQLGRLYTALAPILSER